MAAPKGNQFWKVRSSHGRKPIFPEPEMLWDACTEYFEWVEANPLKSAELVTFQGAGTLVDVPKMRAMTINGLCIFLDISQQAWGEYCKRDGFGEVTTCAQEIIRTQKFEGASGGLLNANIIARDLGLADRSELSGKDGGAIETKEVGERDLARRIAFALQRGGAEGTEPDKG